MAEGGGLGRGAQVEEGLALEGHRRVEVGLGGAAEAGERAERRGLAAGGLASTGFSASSQKPGVGRQRGAVAERRGERRQVGGEGDGAGAQVAVDRRRSIRPSASAFGAFTGLPVVASSTAAAGGDEAGQADGAAGAGDDAEGDFGQADRGGRRAATRKRQASATSKPPPRAEPWMAAIQGFRRRLDAGDEVGQVRRLRRLAELGDVGAGDEGAAGADQDDGVDARVGVERLRRRPRGPGAAPGRGR